MRRAPREWTEFFGTLLLLVGIWAAGLVVVGAIVKIMWRVFMMGWDLV